MTSRALLIRRILDLMRLADRLHRANQASARNASIGWEAEETITILPSSRDQNRTKIQRHSTAHRYQNVNQDHIDTEHTEIAARRGRNQTQPPNHRDTEDTEKAGFFKAGSLRDLGVSVVGSLL